MIKMNERWVLVLLIPDVSTLGISLPLLIIISKTFDPSEEIGNAKKVATGNKSHQHMKPYNKYAGLLGNNRALNFIILL